MAEKAAQVQKDLSRMLEKIDQKLVRPLQKQAFLCSAKCCDLNGTQQDLQECLVGCEQKVRVAQKVIQGEMGAFQNKLQNCARRCQETAEESLYVGGDNPSQTDIDRAQGGMETCISKCADQFRSMIPKVEARIFKQCP